MCYRRYKNKQIELWPGHAKKMAYAICEQQRCRSACASAQSDQHLCGSLLRLYDMYTYSIQTSKILASFCSWAGCFESYLVENLRRHIFAWCGSFDYDRAIFCRASLMCYWHKLKAYFENLVQIFSYSKSIRLILLLRTKEYFDPSIFCIYFKKSPILRLFIALFAHKKVTKFIFMRTISASAFNAQITSKFQ